MPLPIGRVARNKSFASAMPVASEPSQRSKPQRMAPKREHVEGGAVGDPNPDSALHQGALLLECRGLPRETSEPRAPTTLCGACTSAARGVGEESVPGARAAAHDPAPGRGKWRVTLG